MDKMMKVHVQQGRPVKQSDGSWRVILEEFDEMIPDKGRHSATCNRCLVKDEDYPKCTEWCPYEADARKRGLR